MDTPQPQFAAVTQLAAGLTLTTASGVPAGTAGGDQPLAHLAQAGADLGFSLERTLGSGLSLRLDNQSGEGPTGGRFGDHRLTATAVTVQATRGAASVSASIGIGAEQSGIAGLVWDERWGAQADSAMRFAGLAVQTPLGDGWMLRARAEAGQVTAGGGGALGVADPLATTAASVTVTRGFALDFLAPDGAPIYGQLSVSVSQPLRIEGGTLWAMTPRSDAFGYSHLRFERTVLNAVPSGREVDMRLGLDLFAAAALSARGEIGYRVDPGHRADAEPEVFGGFGLRLAY
jgi:hypothetical protein